MHTLTVWDKRSTNFNANAFVKTHGTNSINPTSENQALRLMGCMIHDPQVTRAVYDGPRGCLTWTQHSQDESCECDEDDSMGRKDYPYSC